MDCLYPQGLIQCLGRLVNWPCLQSLVHWCGFFEMRGWIISEYLDSQLWGFVAWCISLVWRSWFHLV